LEGKSLGQPSVFIKREVFETIGPLNTKLHWCLDWAYFLKMLYHFNSPKHIVYIDEILSFSREYKGTKSNLGLDKKGNERRDILKKYFESWLKISLGDQSKAIAATYIVQSLDQFSNGEKIDSILSLFKGLCISPIYISKRIIEKLSSLIK